MSEHSRAIYPAMGLTIKAEYGWSPLDHRIHPGKGWFCWKESPFYIEFASGAGKSPRSRYEKWIFQTYSFIEDVIGGMPSISVDESQIISKTEMSEEEYLAL